MKLREREGASNAGRFAAGAVLVAYLAVNLILKCLSLILWPRCRPTKPKAVCVYRPGNVGDTVCALPALSAIRRQYPDARLVLLTTAGRPGLPGLKDVFANVDWIDEILEYYPREVSLPRSAIAFLRRIRSYRFDVFIELCNDVSLLRTLVRNMLFVRLAGAEWAGGWSINTLRIALQQQSEYIDFPNEVERLVKDVERIGISTVGISYAFPLAAAQERRASAILSSCGLPDEVRMVAIAPGAKRPGSRWPAERFIEVGRRMAGNGYKILLLGTDEEWALAEAIRREIGGTCVNLAGTTDIPTMASILKRCLLLICNDSGPQHVASAVGTPCVAISSFWHLRGKWHAHHPRSVVLQKMVPCHTCFKYDCPNENLCLTEIAASEAAAAALVILDGVSPARAVYASDGERCSASGN